MPVSLRERELLERVFYFLANEDQDNYLLQEAGARLTAWG